MKTTVLDKMKELQELAKKGAIVVEKHPSDDLDLNKETALSRVIKTKEDGELFMKRLQALG